MALGEWLIPLALSLKVELVFPNNDPAASMVAFYGCLLAEDVPLPIEVPLTQKDAGSQQIGFLLGSCGVTLALTSDVCHKGLPKNPTGEIPQFKGEPWPHTPLPRTRPGVTGGVGPRFTPTSPPPLQYKTCKDGSVLGVTVTGIAFLTHCQALTQACGYMEGTDTNCCYGPTDDSNQPPGRGVLSMNGLTYGVIRGDSEEKLPVLTVQDVGLVMPGAIMCSVKPDGIPQLCRTDEVGELCVCAVATGTSYYGLSGMTKNAFEVFLVMSSGAPVSEYPFVRTGLLGFVGPGGLVFTVGKMDGLMVASRRGHNADNIVATVLAMEHMKFVYRGRITVFSVTVLHDERIVIVAEQRLDSTEEDSFQWMSRVLQVVLLAPPPRPSPLGVWLLCSLVIPALTHQLY
ncbi:Disco-interacting protein 2-like protein C [Camelus dromedarius]|uniref:Disco-interacting protein 2-like protein C n=1 Tax=Camelus dromedarius TaxID=9838 RepID=A0A5N4C521_CAMDR|nr:Disco-interacting protein 2-like protein C [Camelus dromedarius]